jgi:hypothetical protein
VRLWHPKSRAQQEQEVAARRDLDRRTAYAMGFHEGTKEGKITGWFDGYEAGYQADCERREAERREVLKAHVAGELTRLLAAADGDEMRRVA